MVDFNKCKCGKPINTANPMIKRVVDIVTPNQLPNHRAHCEFMCLHCARKDGKD